MRPVQTNTSVQSYAVVARVRAYGLIVTLVLALCAAALPVQAQIAFRAAGPQSSGTGASITATIPAGVQSGDLAVLIIAGRPTNTTQPSAPTGWTLRSSSLREVGANDLKIMTFYRVLGASNPNPVVSLPSAWQGNAAGMSAQIVVWSGVNTTTPFDVADVTGNGAAATIWAPPAITTATNGARVVSAAATSDDNALFIGTAQGFTVRIGGANYDTTTGGDHSVGLFDKDQPTAGPVSLMQWRQAANASDPWAGITFALRPAFVNTSPTFSLTSPADGAAFAWPANITLSATASDSDGTIARVEFQIDGNFGENETFTITQPPYTMVWTPEPVVQPPSGYWYTVTAAAYDNQGAVAWTAVTIYLDTPPAVSLTSPTANATFTVPASIPLQAQASDVGGSVSRVEFYHGTTLITTLTAPPYNFNWTGVPQGSYSLTARAFDNLGLQTTSTPVIVTVNGGVATLYFVHVDHLNTPRLVANQSGQTVWRWDQQEPFGVNLPDENPSGLGAFEFPLRFPGQYADKETNLVYNWMRDYDPSLGRYLEADPIGLDGGLNLFGYVDGRPILRTDMRGLAPDGCGSGWFGQFIPNSGFKTCCDSHDLCYEDCNGPNQLQCDMDFCKCVLRKCETPYYSGAARRICHNDATMYCTGMWFSDTAVRAFVESRANCRQCKPNK
jgi:RHS repeat-associated protein